MDKPVNYSDIELELLPLTNEKRLELIAERLTAPFNRVFNKNLEMKSFLDKENNRGYFLYNNHCIDFVEYAITDLRWDIIYRAFDILEIALRRAEDAALALEKKLYNDEGDNEQV